MKLFQQVQTGWAAETSKALARGEKINDDTRDPEFESLRALKILAVTDVESLFEFFGFSKLLITNK